MILMGLDRGETLLSIALTGPDRVVVHGTNRNGKAVVAELVGEELAKHILRRGRKGSRVSYRMKPLRVAIAAPKT